ncbi:unnamed protein product [Cylindrotheca closterium]|uniref:Tryptophan synthase beta chain-like PALP domain-containing protein n=1 Tax=Cylindrotheca closterium TaxID=2856 RepID=A0AAD2G0J1_9STRA|nr:unnamed protein product [Cylindrotheca closterium]
MKTFEMICFLRLLLFASIASVRSLSTDNLPSSGGVAEAYARSSTSGVVVRTPLIESPLINEELNCRLLVKAECLQRTGSFKFRGAFNRLSSLESESANKGVVAFSSGNFGQALAAAATALQIPCCIVSPHDAPAVKLERIQKFGADLVLSTAKPDENREVVASALAQEISATKGMTLLHPFEDAQVIHGQGTCGMELFDQCQELTGSPPDIILIPCGGGGLTAGIQLAVEHYQGSDPTTKHTEVYTVEPRGYDDHARSFNDGKLQSLSEIYSNEPPPSDRSVYCDALMAGAPGEITWSVNGPRLKGALESSGDASAANGMKVAFDHYRLVLEPSGALGLAAVLDGQVDVTDKTVVVIASGGNIDLEVFGKLMEMVE